MFSISSFLQLWRASIALPAILIVGSGVAPAAAGGRAPVVYYPGQAQTAADARAALLNDSQDRGEIRVIVQLGGTGLEGGGVAAPKATTSHPSQRAAQASLRAAQDALLAALAPPAAAPRTVGGVAVSQGPVSVTRYETIPFLAFSADGATIRRLLALPHVVSVQEDIPLRPLLAQSVPLIGASQAWAAGFDGTGQAVAVIDSGVAKSHPMLAGKVVSEACYSTTSSASTSLCPDGAAESTDDGSGANCATGITGCDHGTHVASIAVGNSTTLKGVAPGADLIAIKVMSRFANAADCSPLPAPCTQAYLSDVTRALERVYVLSRRSTPYAIAAVNLSIGSSGLYISACNDNFPALTAAITNLYNAGIATTISAGNDGDTGVIGAPACIRPAIAVGSTTKTDVVSTFSNLSAQVDLMAPGTSIRAAVPGGGMATKSGTSMSAAFVAGAWAILRQAKPTAGVAEVLSALACTGKSVTRNGVTKPRIQVLPALKVLQSAAPGCS